MPVINELIRSEKDELLALVIMSWILSLSYRISNIVEILIRLKHSRK